MNFDNVKRVHMIGIKGVGMTMLAQFLVSKNFILTGSDTDEVFMTDEVLKKIGVHVKEKFSKDNIKNNIDLIIYSTAYNTESNIELAQAFKSGIDILSYSEALAIFFNKYYGIAVVGTHGKTTVSAWIGYVMMKSKLSPNVLVGSRVNQFGGSSIVGDSNYFVIEADEYQNKLQYYNPKVVILNNIDYDHHDFFKTENDYVRAFSDFVAKIPNDGFIVANFDDNYVVNIVDNHLFKVISYGIKNDKVNFFAYNVKQKDKGQSFEIIKNGEKLGLFSIKLLGIHNVYNALAVVSTCLELGLSLDDIKKYLGNFSGTARRMELMGKFKGVEILDDYAHHPTEIKTTLQGLNDAYPNRKIKAVFHPHLFSRTVSLIDKFAESFELVDELIILDIYSSAREKSGGVHSLDLVEKIKLFNKKNNIKQKIVYAPRLKDAEKYLRSKIEIGDIVILLGAGDVFRIGENLVNENNNK